MTRRETQALLAPHAEALQRFGVKSLAVFGSVARDQARADSDVDFLVDFDGPTTFDAFMGLKTFLEDLLRCRVDLVTRGSLKPRVRPKVEREAVRVP